MNESESKIAKILKVPEDRFSNFLKVFKPALKEFEVQKVSHVAYLLCTVKVESDFLPIKEIRAKPGTRLARVQDKYWSTGYFGRGYVQITWRANYLKIGDRLGIPGLVQNPDLALQPDIAARILVGGCALGLFTGLSLRHFDTGTPPFFFRFYEARRIVNALDKAPLLDSLCKQVFPFLV